MVSDVQTKKELLPMAHSNFNGNFEKMLLQFMSEDDPMLSMLKWLCEQLMEAEVTSKVNAAKSERNSEWFGYRSGYRVHRFYTRMGSCKRQVLLDELGVRTFFGTFYATNPKLRLNSNGLIAPKDSLILFSLYQINIRRGHL